MQWTCKCVRKYLQKASGCVPIPTKILEDKYEFNVDSNAAGGISVGQINLINLNGITVDSTPTLVPDNADFSITTADSSSFTLNKVTNMVFINTVQLTLIVSSTLPDDSTIVDYTEVTIIPNINSVETTEIILAEGTRKGSFVSDTPGLNKYTSSVGHSYALAGAYKGYFSVDGHGDIFCAKTISLDEMGLSPDSYAFVTEIQINRILLASNTLKPVAKLSILVVRDKFSLDIAEDTATEKNIGRFSGDFHPFGFKLTDVSTQEKFYTYFTYDTDQGFIKKSNALLDFTRPEARDFQFEIEIHWKSPDEYIKIPGEIMVYDVNNNPPTCDSPEFIFQVISGSPLGTYIGLVQTNDLDTVGTVTYSINDAVYSQAFTITPHSGVLIAEQAITASKLGERINFTVNANDGFGTADCLIVVEILKLSEENANLGMSFNGTIEEELHPPVHVTNVFVQNYTNFKFMTTKDNEYFKLNSTTGEVTSIQKLDREHLPNDFRGNTVTFGIQANLDDEDSCTITIIGDLTITVKDINDNSPCFNVAKDNCTSSVTFEGRITENVTHQQEVIFVNPTYLKIFDPDEDDNDDLTVEIQNKHFKYTVQNNFITIFTDVVFDREKTDSTSLVVYVKDRVGTHTATATLTIKVIDVNDNKPIFTQSSYTYNVSEDTHVGVEVGFVNATDLDTGNNADILYSISSSYFSVDETTGHITIKRKLDRESIASYNEPMFARDNGQPSFTTTTAVSIQILDVNDNSPVFSRQEYRRQEYENNNCSIPIGKVTATDADIGNNARINFTVSNPQEFTINQNGEIFCRESLDYESNRNPILIVTATDNGSPSRSSSTLMVIEVLDKNDNPPTFAHNVTTVNVTKADFQSEKVVALLDVTDKDTGDNGRLSFQICTEYNNSFEIINSGAVYTRAVVPENFPSPKCVITATDHGIPQLSSTACIEFYIASSDDHVSSGVKFNSSDSVLFVEEEKNSVEVIGKLQIIGNVTSNVTFTMISSLDGTVINNTLTSNVDNGSFYLDPKSGSVRKTGALDRENKDTYTFLASVEEGSAKDLALVTVNVTDINESPQIVTPLKQFKVYENDTNSIVFSSKIATDRDLGNNGTLNFSLIKQEPMADNSFNFHVDTSNGTITVVRALDYEHVKRYNITIEARDMGTPDPLSATHVFDVLVIDVNDNPPTFVNATNVNGLCSYNINVYENISADSVVLDFGIADKDDHLLFQKSNLFVVGQSDCPLKAVSHAFPDMSLLSDAVLDYESQKRYECVIEVTNVASPYPSSNCSVHVNVQDVNDNVPETHGPYVVNVTDGKINDVILVINATDADSGTNSLLVYDYVEKTESTNYFDIDSSTGAITIVKNLFQFTSAEARLYIKVSDKGDPPKSNRTEVLINIISNNTEPWFPGSGGQCSGGTALPIYKYSIKEVNGQSKPDMNEAISEEIVVSVTACDKDEGKFVTCNCSYAFAEGEHTYFAIDKTTGMIRQIKRVDREKTPYFLLNITATDHGNPPRQSKQNAELHISVEDLDDNPPHFNDSRIEFNVPNTAAVGTTYGPVRATDPDCGKNAEVIYTIPSDEHGHFLYNTTSGYFKVSKSLTNQTGQTFPVMVTATGVITETFTASSLVVFNVYYDDPNKSPPTFNKSIYEASITFDDTKGHVIGTYVAMDTDADKYGELQYSLESSNWETFVVDNGTGTISLQYDVKDAIPYYIKSVNLTLWATDGGNPPKSGSCLIHINVKDMGKKECPVTTAADKQNRDKEFEIPLYAVTGVAVCLLLLLVIGFLVMFSRNRGNLNKYKMSLQRLSSLNPDDQLKGENYQRLSKVRTGGEYNKTFDGGFTHNFMYMKDQYEMRENYDSPDDQYEHLPEPTPDYDTPI